MTTKLEYEKLNQLIPAGFFEDMAKYEDPDDMFCETEANHSIRVYIQTHYQNGTKLTSQDFGKLIGINKGNTIRAKINGQSRFTQSELQKIHELTSISMDTLVRENPKLKHNTSDLITLGRINNEWLRVSVMNKANVGVKQICIYPEDSDAEIIYKIDSREKLKDFEFYYNPRTGRHFDAIIYFSDGTETYVDDVEPAETSRIVLRRNNKYSVTEPVTSQYMLLVKIPRGDYYPAMYLNKDQASYFIKKYGKIEGTLPNFFSTYGGSVCDGKFYLVEDF